MRIAFVGVQRKYQEFQDEYIDFFNQYHLELPHYYAAAANEVTITSVDYTSPRGKPVGAGHLSVQKEESFVRDDVHYDIVIHWRKWFPHLYRSEAINVINCQDHTFSQEWKETVRSAAASDKLWGILCFPGWHEKNLKRELGFDVRTISGLTLGVDTEIYHPSDKKVAKRLLWASDPGRGLHRAVQLAIELWRKDREFRLDVCYPDYVKQPVVVNHPAVKVLGAIPNGPKLWDLFNEAGVLPYTSCFMEPSSRAHRQAQAAGCLVLYPPNMGTPSELIEDGRTGFVRDIGEWADLIINTISSPRYDEIRNNARAFAVAENWRTQAIRFNEFFAKALGDNRWP